MEVKKNKVKHFYTGYTIPAPVGQKCDDRFVPRYKEIAPFSMNNETGEILNKTAKPKLVRINDFNMYEYIQSFREETDLKTILKKYSQTGDTSLLNKSVGSFADIVNIPDNIHEFNKVNGDLAKKLEKFSPKLKDAILSGNNTDLSALVAEEVKKLFIAHGGKLDDLVQKESTKEEKKE